MGGQGNGRAREWEGKGMGVAREWEWQGNGKTCAESDSVSVGSYRSSTISAERVVVSSIATVGRP